MYRGLLRKTMAVFLTYALTLMSASAQQGATITNGSAEGLAPAFLFEPEFPLASLKTVPTWNELEQLLDNPYGIALCSQLQSQPPLVRNTPGNDQGYPSYCTTSAIGRRPGFGVNLPPLLVHPLNYNPTTGEGMRLINPGYPGGTFSGLNISPGSTRVEDGEAAIDYNSPILCPGAGCRSAQFPDGDPGEPAGYSSPAATSGVGPLFDPARGVINARNPGTGAGGLRKPSLRLPEVGGSPNNPNYLINTDPDNVVPSSENDYVRNRQRAMELGKALFWDMQVGSDSVQSCGSCHFHAGADNRTKNQINPNHLNNDLSFQVRQPNEDLIASDFPFHKLGNPDVAGDPACTSPIVATVDPGVLTNVGQQGVTATVCDAGNTARDANDVASSMGVHFGKFKDIPPIGAASFGPPSGVGGVRSLVPDLRSDNPTDNIDPIPGFQGTDNSGHGIRRVEPRNTPTLFLSAMNFDNFWDGRARHDFNGGSVFGASDPQTHVFVTRGGTLRATRQIIRFVSLASLATGPALSEFEMSFMGRNWAKIGKKLLQGTVAPSATSVTPLANQLVATNDSILGRWSNQGGSQCLALGRPTQAGKPGLCTTYRELIQMAFYPSLWQNTGQHLNGAPDTSDPFDGYSLSIAGGAAVTTDTDQFTQMEGNMPLFFGLAVHLWGTILMPDNTPFDRFLDANPDMFASIGEPGEPGLVGDLPDCTSPTQRFCFRPLGQFQRNPAPGAPDPLLGMDIFQGSNFSLKNSDFRAARCGECHAGPTLTDNTMPFTHKAQLGDFSAEFVTPGVEVAVEPLGRPRVISGFLLESEIMENGQDGVERRIINQSIAPNPQDGLAYPDGISNPPSFLGAGASFFDNGVYNLGVRPIVEDLGRGGNDPFGWPLSLAALMLKNLGGPAQEPGNPLSTFNPSADPDCAPGCGGGGLFDESAQDPQINEGLEGEPANPLLPAHLAPWVNNVNVGDAHPELDEVHGGINTLTDVAILEGFIDVLGPFNPAATLNEALNSAEGPFMGTWPVVNRVGRMGSFKAPQLREVELTGPYFHNGGKLTLRQVVDFYTHGGDFPVTNAEHRDFNLVNLNIEVQSNLSEEEKVALVDFLLTLTDDRVKFESAPFDHPEVFVPVDGTAPENTFGRDGFLANLANGMFRQVPAVGATGGSAPLPAFLGLSNNRLTGPAAFCGDAATSHYCH